MKLLVSYTFIFVFCTVHSFGSIKLQIVESICFIQYVFMVVNHSANPIDAALFRGVMYAVHVLSCSAYTICMVLSNVMPNWINKNLMNHACE